MDISKCNIQYSKRIHQSDPHNLIQYYVTYSTVTRIHHSAQGTVPNCIVQYREVQNSTEQYSNSLGSFSKKVLYFEIISWPPGHWRAVYLLWSEGLVLVCSNLFRLGKGAGGRGALIRGILLFICLQIVINSVHLEQTNIALEEFISELTGAQQDEVHVARLQVKSVNSNQHIYLFGTWSPLVTHESCSCSPGAVHVQGHKGWRRRVHLQEADQQDERVHWVGKLWLDAQRTNSNSVKWHFIQIFNCPRSKGHASPWLMDLIAFLKSIFESFTNLVCIVCWLLPGGDL